MSNYHILEGPLVGCIYDSKEETIEVNSLATGWFVFTPPIFSNIPKHNIDLGFSFRDSDSPARDDTIFFNEGANFENHATETYSKSKVLCDQLDVSLTTGTETGSSLLGALL